jgi:predicted peptidase
MALTMQALKQVINTENVDTSRIYVTGVSMGAFGTWDILRRDPGTFAAAVPMSGGGDPATAAAIKDVPIWAFHGSADSVVNVQGTRDMINALHAVGSDAKYTEIAGGDHVIWPSVYADPSNTLYSWLFSQRLASGVDPTTEAAAAPVAVASAPVEAPIATGPVAVPEPASLGLVLVGAGALLRRRRR